MTDPAAPFRDLITDPHFTANDLDLIPPAILDHHAGDLAVTLLAGIRAHHGTPEHARRLDLIHALTARATSTP